MKKRYCFLTGILFAFIFLILSAQSAFAVSLNGASAVRLIPYCVFYDSGRTTVIGLQSPMAGTAYWVFCDQNGTPLKRGQFNMAAHQMYVFNWATEGGASLAGKVGYLTFAMDVAPADGTLDNGENLTSNAFYVDVTSQDAVFIPTVEAGVTGISNALTTTTTNIFLFKQFDWSPAGYGTYSAYLYLRYFIDMAPGGNDTKLVIFSAQDIAPTQSMVVMDDNGNAAPAIVIATPNKRLNVIDPESTAGWPASYLDGTIQWNIPSGVQVYGFSIVESSSLGAAQTLVGNWSHF